MPKLTYIVFVVLLLAAGGLGYLAYKYINSRPIGGTFLPDYNKSQQLQEFIPSISPNTNPIKIDLIPDNLLENLKKLNPFSEIYKNPFRR